MNGRRRDMEERFEEVLPLEEACGISGDGGLRRSDRGAGVSGRERFSNDGRGSGMGRGGASVVLVGASAGGEA